MQLCALQAGYNNNYLECPYQLNVEGFTDVGFGDKLVGIFVGNNGGRRQ